jgi:hypothetical protein
MAPKNSANPDATMVPALLLRRGRALTRVMARRRSAGFDL